MGSRAIRDSLGPSQLISSPSLTPCGNRREGLCCGVCLDAHLNRPDEDPRYTQALREEGADAEAAGDEVVGVFEGGGGAEEGAEGCEAPRTSIHYLASPRLVSSLLVTKEGLSTNRSRSTQQIRCIHAAQIAIDAKELEPANRALASLVQKPRSEELKN
ncbi:hypothetical protein V500_03646 [Pseudogymnoascus sp. VKM F-4518 (FW-2643)]|nr:hypothetical protein V500_03646 [Pseudogymnoascus sp. VKM F-4518 (FW-2643)]